MNSPGKEILGRWLHSHEEDSAAEMVFRPSTFAFPPSRCRVGFESNDNGSYVARAIRPWVGLAGGLGGDGAVWLNGPRSSFATIATTDTLVADVHFLPDATPWADLGLAAAEASASMRWPGHRFDLALQYGCCQSAPHRSSRAPGRQRPG